MQLTTWPKDIQLGLGLEPSASTGHNSRMATRNTALVLRTKHVFVCFCHFLTGPYYSHCGVKKNIENDVCLQKPQELILSGFDPH